MEARGTSAMEAQGTSPNFEAIRALHLADRSLGADKLIAKLKQQRPDLNVSASEVRATLRSLRRFYPARSRNRKFDRSFFCSRSRCSVLEYRKANRQEVCWQRFTLPQAVE